MQIKNLPTLQANNETLSRAFRVAIGDICSNLVQHQEGQLTAPAICLAAGLNYPTLWTRDNAVNTLNFTGLFMPEVGESSLRSVLEHDPERGGWRIGGQYWDAILWAWGSWNYYLYRGDKTFLAESLEIVERSLPFFEDTEFDAERGLFRGPAFFQDGISGYPDELSNNFGSDVRDWVKGNSDKVHPVGFGIPWFALSTNCIYVRGYQVVNQMREELGLERSEAAGAKELALKASIRKSFWNDRRGSFDYLLLPDGRTCEHQEGAGLAFAILFDVATEEQTTSIFKTVQRTPAGIPAVWPHFPRFDAFGEDHFGRHSGSVWPQVQALWARAALKAGNHNYFIQELELLAAHAVRDGHFTEIYHPVTGEEYGGLQEHWRDSYIHEWPSVPHTCWGACSLIGLIHFGLLGMDYSTQGIRFAPFLSNEIDSLTLTNISYRNSLLKVTVTGKGSKLSRCLINGQEAAPFLASDITGDVSVELFVSE